jgi:hypothetical protein
MTPPQTIVTNRNLYDVHPETGIGYIRYGVGDELPVEEFKRLAAREENAGAGVVESKAHQAPEPVAPKPTRTELVIEAKQLGLEIASRASVAQIEVAIAAAKAEEAAKGEDGEKGEDQGSDGEGEAE